KPVKTLSPLFSDAGFSQGDGEDPHARMKFEMMRLVDPATGAVPMRMRARELAYAGTLPKDEDFIANIGIKGLTWEWRGPWNLGGRTRGLAIDVTNENILIAGSVSGGVWRSNDGGNSWIKTTTAAQNYGATCIVQDTRPGKTHIWYFSSGEPYGTSASGGSAFYLGNGLYKSTDGGITWNSVSSTVTSSPQTFSHMDLIWNLALDPSDTINDVIYMATYGRIYRSDNGGNTWTTVLGNTGGSSYFTDIAVTSGGIVYASLSDDGNSKGIWRSVDGLNWINITSPNWPPVYDRVVIGISPSYEDDVYFLGVTPGFGQYNALWHDREEWTSLWKYTYISGDGSGNGGKWENRSSSIPHDGNEFDHFNAQGSYNLVIKVKPNDTNVVFIGGTNLYRSDDAFRSDSNTTQIGGYQRGTTLPNYVQYPNQHPDQHGLVFLPSNNNIAFSNSDGGLAKTLNNMADTVEWISLNNGYITSQFYTLAIDQGTPGDKTIVGGLQDNGTYFTNSSNPTSTWTMPSKGDGSYCAIEDGHNMYYFSRQNGKMLKATLDSNGNPTAFALL
ncbi:WD40/YVTN/BNR-like repeat-containing protein, partial [candidate division KSB1 bacterium]